jgi:hypothetical protein
MQHKFALHCYIVRQIKSRRLPNVPQNQKKISSERQNERSAFSPAWISASDQDV